MSRKLRMLPCSMAALAALMGSQTIWAAAPASDVIQHRMAVQYADLNLDRFSDAAVLYDRIAVAAGEVCGPRTLTGSYGTAPGFARCFTNAISQAVASIDNPRLTTVYRERLTHSDMRALSLAEK
jgi:UrcA family protein